MFVTDYDNRNMIRVLEESYALVEPNTYAEY